ncbi:MAG: transcription elongation factor GreA, partial [Selenomonadaceae bacterium]|nr:transcription elongation factor GreA [Selenomonadaceae bacterium]
MADKSVLLTEEGLKKLQEELEYLKGTKRLEVADRLKAAIALGDLSENSEYDDAKNEQAFLEGKIMELEEKLRHSEIIKASDDNNTVSMGSLVVLKDVEFDEVETYRIVGSTEADP